jgi:hypothetical protein
MWVNLLSNITYSKVEKIAMHPKIKNSFTTARDKFSLKGFKKPEILLLISAIPVIVLK